MQCYYGHFAVKQTLGGERCGHRVKNTGMKDAEIASHLDFNFIFPRSIVRRGRF